MNWTWKVRNQLFDIKWSSLQNNTGHQLQEYCLRNDFSSYIRRKQVISLTHCGLVMPYGVRELSQYWFTHLQSQPHIDGILPKGPYPPCLRMADRALLAGYPQSIPWDNELRKSWVQLYHGHSLLYIHKNIAHPRGWAGGCLLCTHI